MPAGPVFPAFIKLEYQNDGSARGAFLSAVDNTLGAAEKRLAQFSNEASRQLGVALSTPRTAGGSLNLDVAGQQAAANAAKARAVAARELATATSIAAKENGDFSQSTRLAVAALQAQAREEEQAAAAALSHARALEQVQGVLNRQASAVTTLTGATRRSVAVNDNATVSAGQHRAALNQLSFQLGDVAQGFALGTPPAIIFAQQIGQVTQAVQLMGGGGALGGVAKFLGGGWGIALNTAAVVLSPLIAKLFETKDAAEQVKFATNAVGDAQSILGGVLDIATGKINTQSSALIGLAKAQLLVAQVQARTRAADARRGVADIQSRPVRFTGGGLGGGFSAGRRDVDARDTISAQVLGGALDSATAVQRLENLRRVGRLTDEEFTAAASSVANLGVELENLKVYGDANRSIEIQRLRVQGREAEADVLAYQYDLATKIGSEDREGIDAALAKLGISKSEYAQGIANLGVQRQLTREAQRASAQQQRQLGFIADTRSNLVQTVASLRTDGVGAVGGFFDRAVDQFNAAAAEHLVDKLFGSAFQSAEDQVTQAHRLLAQSSLTAAKALNSLAGSTGTADGSDPAGSEISNEILVLGKKIEDFNNPRDLVRLIGREIAKSGGLSEEDAARLGKSIGSAFQGAAIGSVTSGVLKSLGVKSSTTGAQIGGAIGSALPIPGGQIIGSIIGGLIGGALKKAKTGSASLTVGSDGVAVGSLTGNSGSRKQAASGAAGSVSDALNRIAEQLGGSADGPISVSIGIRDKNYRVDTTGSGKTKKSAGAVDFGQDQAAALKFAIADAIKDGVITGISAGAQRLIQSGKDVDRQLQKALDFEGTIARARALTDPVGAALDTLDKEFSRLDRIFAEAGASAEQYASLEQLYASDRAKAVKEAEEAITGSLKSLLDDLGIGNDALSLRDRRTAALAKYDPLKTRVAGGDSTAFDDFAEAARALLDIERQASGSQGGYFARLDEVKGLSQAQVDWYGAIAASSIGRDSPLSSNPLPIDNANVVNAIADQTQALLDGLGVKLDALIANQGALISLSGPSQTPLYLPQAVGYF